MRGFGCQRKVVVIRQRENQYVEFKQEAVTASELAEEMVAFANAEGGEIRLGVDDHGRAVGLSREEFMRPFQRGILKLSERRLAACLGSNSCVTNRSQAAAPPRRLRAAGRSGLLRLLACGV